METLIFKIILSSFLLIAFYYVFLEKEKTFRFNRMYLLFAIVFAFIIPFIPIVDPFQTAGNPTLIVGEMFQEVQKSNVSGSAKLDFNSILFAIYGLVSVFFLTQFIYSLLKIILLKGEMRQYKNHQIIVVEKNCAPFSFLDTIYFSKNYLVQNQIDERIFLHEKCHVDERHSLDILFIEFLKIFFWFNPALFLYKRAMVANHEFLADEYVLQNDYDVEHYQHLILNEIKTSQILNLTHQFDFNNTKKRFIMMTSKNSRFATVKKLTLLPLLSVVFLLFAKKVNAQSETQINAEPAAANSANQNETLAEIKQPTAFIEKTTVSTFDELKIDQKMQLDTIRKNAAKSEEAIAPPPPPPPPPREFKGVLPQFPEGINAFRTLLGKNFNTSVLSGDEELVRTEVTFVINTKGKMTDVKSTGTNLNFNKEAERVVALLNETVTWTPAMEDGQAVDYVFRFPLTMKFEKSNLKK